MSILIISNRESDLSKVLKNSAKCTMLSFDNAEGEDLSKYTSIAVLFSTDLKRAQMLSSALRIKIEEFADSGRPVFYEWCGSLGYAYSVANDLNDGSDLNGDATSRYVYVGDDNEDLSFGDLLDSQANVGSLYRCIPETAKLILYSGGHILKHDHVDKEDINVSEIPHNKWRLWYYDKNRLVCSFHFADFVKSRFVPFKAWCGILKLILKHLGVEQVELPKPYYTLGYGGDTLETFNRGMKWFDGCDILLDDGRKGVEEGLKHTIYPYGEQERTKNVRVDCVGEVAGAYFFDYLLNKNEKSFEVFNNLYDFIFNKMQVNGGKFDGMLRWTECAWHVTYADDTGRAILGALFYMMYTGDYKMLPNIERSLDFLVSLTGTDGLIEHGINCFWLSDKKVEEMRSKATNQPMAHGNAYYCAVLLLAYMLNKKQIYLTTACKGLESMMKNFPNTFREISETEEICRLIFPLACLYHVTGLEKHKNWLYLVCEKLSKYRHKSGGYLEIDTGYTAFRSRTQGTESSMLADNGNEIAELLYSLNWLPLGFSYAYYATGDKVFMDLWEDISKFMTSAQIVSDDKTIDGAWARALDLKRMEIYGMPHDVGWGPFCIESGWTVAEILMGLGFGMALKKGITPVKCK